MDNFWFRSVDFDSQPIKAPLRGSHKADVVIVGGGYTGLSAAFHIRQRFPNKKIALIEGARCGYGASGRNGGFCITTDWIDGLEDLDPEKRRQALDVASYGLRQIKHLITEHGLECDLEENGMLDVALTDKQVKSLTDDHALYDSLGLESTLLDGGKLKAEIDSPVFKAGLVTPDGAILNPAKLVLGMKRIAEEAGVGGVDVLWIETIFGFRELAAAIEAAASTGLPVASTMTFDTGGRTMMGDSPKQASDFIHSISPRLIAYGANCGAGPAMLVDTISEFGHSARDGDVIIAKGNCGVPQTIDGRIVYSGDDETMARYARLARDAGARIIGGCCGTSPARLKAIAEALDGYEPGEIPNTAMIESILGPIPRAKQRERRRTARSRRRAGAPAR